MFLDPIGTGFRAAVPHNPALRFINYVNSGMAEQNGTTRLAKLQIPEPRGKRARDT
jgi:hypothetical protein